MAEQIEKISKCESLNWKLSQFYYYYDVWADKPGDFI